MKKESIFLTCLALCFVILLAPPAKTQSARDLKATEEQVRKDMLQLTKELGTTCTECHNVNDFKNDAKPSFRVGAQHLKLVAAMKANGFDGKKGPEANCYMCHRGELKPPAALPK